MAPVSSILSPHSSAVDNDPGSATFYGMSVQFKFREDVGEDRRREIIDALGRAGFAARSLFPKQKRAALASIFTLRDAEAQDLKALRNTLRGYGAEIEYVEAAPQRTLKTVR
jgi:hypothetical protein